MKRFFNETLIAVAVAAALAVGTYSPLLGLSDARDPVGLQPARADDAARLKLSDGTGRVQGARASRDSVDPT